MQTRLSATGSLSAVILAALIGPSPAHAGISGKVVAHYGGEFNQTRFDTTGTPDTRLTYSIGVSTDPGTFSTLTADTATGTFSALVQSRYSGESRYDGGAIADIVHTEGFVVSGSDPGDVGYLRFSMNGTLWKNQGPDRGVAQALVYLHSTLTTPQDEELTLNYAWSACSDNEPLRCSGLLIDGGASVRDTGAADRRWDLRLQLQPAHPHLCRRDGRCIPYRGTSTSSCRRV